jgi:hypothetical protein
LLILRGRSEIFPTALAALGKATTYASLRKRVPATREAYQGRKRPILALSEPVSASLPFRRANDEDAGSGTLSALSHGSRWASPTIVAHERGRPIHRNASERRFEPACLVAT